MLAFSIGRVEHQIVHDGGAQVASELVRSADAHFLRAAHRDTHKGSINVLDKSSRFHVASLSSSDMKIFTVVIFMNDIATWV